MGDTIAQKIIRTHLTEGEMVPGAEIGLRIDQTLTQDATGTMAYLQFQAMGIGRVKTRRSVAYVDHNTLQCGFENADDHRYIQTVARGHGIWFSRPGNGICHQVHLERFCVPGGTLIGSDSHTTTGGGVGMLAMGSGGLDVAVAMGGGAYYIAMPKMMRINLVGKLRPWVSAKDVILEVLRRLSVKGGVGYILEYAGDGVKTLSVPERGTIANMGTETGATTSLFPSDEVTRQFLRAQGREEDFIPLAPDPDAVYDAVLDIDLGALKPLVACPHMPDNIREVSQLAGLKVDQICIGSCTNSSLADMLRVARILKGKKVHPDLSLSISPGSRQVLSMLSQSGALTDLIDAGARIMECTCGPCIGMGLSPSSGGVSLRTFNRNFEGRSGTADAQVYLVSPETAAASAIAGVLTDPTTLPGAPDPVLPAAFAVDDSGVLSPLPPEEAQDAQVVMGPNIQPVPQGVPLTDAFTLPLLLKVGDNITTDHIMPAGSKILPYRSNIPYLSRYCFSVCDPDFPARAREQGGGVVLGGANYGQGSSREHAALVPLYLGVRAVVAVSFARIHRANLINAGILPLTLKHPADYEKLSQGDRLSVTGLWDALDRGQVTILDETTGEKIMALCDFSPRQRRILKAGGLLNDTRSRAREEEKDHAAVH